jgi:hypothetical protein
VSPFSPWRRLPFLFQLFPSLGSLFNVRNWSRSTWFVMNASVVLALITVRFGPDLVADWRKRCQRLAAERAKAEKILSAPRIQCLTATAKVVPVLPAYL